MKFSRYILLMVLGLIVALPSRAELTVLNSDNHPAIEVSPSSSSGLQNVWVVFDASTTQLRFELNGISPAEIKWYKFSKTGGAYVETVTSGISTEGNASVLSTVESNMGYTVEVAGRTYHYWITDYSKSYLHINSINFGEEQDCDMTTIIVDGDCEPLVYYTINGQRITINRDINLTYNTLQWNPEISAYATIEVNKTIASFSEAITTTAPLCNTVFTLSGDKFLEIWQLSESAESDLYITQAVEVQATATRSNPDDSNGDLGGSAPAIIEFVGYFTDATIFREWQISSDAEFEQLLYRFSDDRITYNFSESGKFYARFVGANASGTCESTSETFEIIIDGSRLECPNAFSPYSDIESSKIWRVTYKSIVEFDCHIFNRYGVELYSYTDPEGGWDGSYKGSTVGTGVYFYVITARGADGKKYNLKGDINILKLKQQ